MSSKRILCVGLVCVDVVQVCSAFPQEDTDQRCVEQHWQRGGNASNNCTVLSQLDANCEYFGTISGGIFCGYVTSDFELQNILIDNCVYHDGFDFPLSIVIINSQNGSRTIIHSNKNLPELTIENFKELDLSIYSWIHFEGRNIGQVQKMIEYAKKWRLDHDGNFQVSVELEKPCPELQLLANAADVIFVGKDYAKYRGFKSKEETVEKLKAAVASVATIICAWGESGACAFSEVDGFVSSPANIQRTAVDTLGAGDTFCAAVVYSLNEGYRLGDSISFGCQVAGEKVGILGFKQLKEVSDAYLKDLHSKSKQRKK